MSGRSFAEHIDAIDAYARTLFVRAKQSPAHAVAQDLSTGIQRLHLALRHLRIEIADPDSPVNSADEYAHRLGHLLEGVESALKLLEHVLNRHGAVVSDGVAAAKSKLAHERRVIDDFLDMVQLKDAPRVVGGQPGLEAIKEKLDTVAQRLFARDNSAHDDGDLWREFKTELEEEGFSPNVLEKHKDVLRAYIRELQSLSARNGGAPPSVQGLLDDGAGKLSTRRNARAASDDEKSSSSSIEQRRQSSKEVPIAQLQKQFSDDRRSRTPGELTDQVTSPVLISTRDLVAMDSPIDQPPARSRGVSFSSPRTVEPRDIKSPRSSHTRLSPTHHEPPGPSIYGSSAPAEYGIPHVPRVAPDSHGRDIPMDAQWTKIKRSLVSPEVFHRAGVRYEARPEYVAVLGRLSRDQVVHYARLSAECRAARQSRYDDGSDSSSSDSVDDSDEGGKTYPIIVNPPDASPTSTIMPKPILKNKNRQARHDDDQEGLSRRRYEDEHDSRRDERRRRDERHHRERHHERDDHHRHERGRRRRTWERLGAVGIGGAAVSLLGILAEAAVGS